MWRGRHGDRSQRGDATTVWWLFSWRRIEKPKVSITELNQKLIGNKEIFHTVIESPHGDPGKDYTSDPHHNIRKLQNPGDKERIVWAGIRNEDPIGRSYQKEIIV